MGDFDDALERLIGDPAFRAALAADPDRALAGYTLSPDERDLLGAQVDAGTGGERQVEQRTSKASLFGLLSPMGGTGLADAWRGGDVAPGSSARAAEPFAPGRGFHTGGGIGLGGEGTTGPGIATGGATTDALESTHEALHERPDVRTPRPYETRVDADGDGTWDDFTAVDRGAAGYDLVVDRDGDGRAEFVGHDHDRDGLIDAATTDTDGDGRLDTTWVDTDGDGWLDRRGAPPEEPPAAGGGRHRAL